jgi:hypothetical protein
MTRSRGVRGVRGVFSEDVRGREDLFPGTVDNSGNRLSGGAHRQTNSPNSPNSPAEEAERLKNTDPVRTASDEDAEYVAAERDAIQNEGQYAKRQAHP